MLDHWSRKLYMDAKKEGYKFFVRQHIMGASDADAGQFKLHDEKEMWDIPFIKKWQTNELYKDCFIPKNHKQAFKRWKTVEYTDDGERLLSAHLNDSSHWVVAYLMDLEKFEIEANDG